MKTSYLPKGFAIAIAFSIAAIVSTAQNAEAPAGKVDWSKQIRIKKMVGTGRQAVEKTPTYNTSANRSITREQEWYRVWVHYETAPEWIDEIVFTYHILARTKVKGQEAFSLYRKTIKYMDVPKGRDHVSVAYLRPNTVKRYGEVVAAAVEITVNGEPAAEQFQWDLPAKMPEKWWKNPNVVESAAVTIREGYLLDRSQTPFAFINVDDYEAIK